MRKRWVFFVVAISVFIFSFPFNADNVDAAVCGNSFCETGEDYNFCPNDCRCGNGICEAGEGELEFCPTDCEGKFISGYGEDCPAGACTAVDSTSSCSGTGTNYRCDCLFSVSSGCFTCPRSSGNLWYSAWGDYACRLQGQISTCNTALAPPTIADFYVNSCDGSEGCCGQEQSSCIKADECGQKATDGLIKAKGADGVLGTADDWFYGGGTLGVCRDKCNPSADTCRTLNGQAQRCVSCSYRADSLWNSEFGNVGNNGLWSTTNIKNGVWVDDPGCLAAVSLQCDITDNNCAKSSGNFNCPSESQYSRIALTYSGAASKPIVSKLTTDDVNNPSQRGCSLFDAVTGDCVDTLTAQGLQGFTLDSDLKVAGYSGVANTLVGNCNFYFGCPLGQEWDYTLKACVDDIKNCVNQLNGNCGLVDAATSIEMVDKNNCVLPDKCLQCKTGFTWNQDLKKCVAGCDSSATSVLAGKQGGCTSLNLAASDVANDLIATANECQNSKRCVACKAGYVWKGVESTTKGCLPGCAGEGQACSMNGVGSDACCNPIVNYCSVFNNNAGYCCAKGWYWSAIFGACRQALACENFCPDPKKPSNLGLPKGNTASYWYTPLCFNDIIEGLPYEEACLTTTIYGDNRKYYLSIKVLDVNGNKVTPVEFTF